MANSKLLKRIRVARRDLGNLLFHFTRNRYASGQQRPEATASQVLREILREGYLRGSDNLIKGAHKCICFTEAPISEIAALFQLASIAADESERPKYEPYGIAVTKEWLFSFGGRHVIYEPDSEYEKLPGEFRHRHVRYEPNEGIDFTWEREWRVKADQLPLNPEQTLVVVPTSQEAFDLMFEMAKWEAEFDEFGAPVIGCPKPKWLVVSLDFFGLPKEDISQS